MATLLPQRQMNYLALCFGFGWSALNFKYVLDIRPNGVRNFCRIIRFELGDTFWTRPAFNVLRNDICWTPPEQDRAMTLPLPLSGETSWALAT